MKNYDHVIWDFNGTLLDDVLTGIRSVNTLLCERGLTPIPDKEYYRKIFRFPIIEYYRSLGFDFDSEPYEELAPKWVALYLENVKKASLYDDVAKTLEYIKGKGRGLSDHTWPQPGWGSMRSDHTRLQPGQGSMRSDHPWPQPGRGSMRSVVDSLYGVRNMPKH